MYIYIAKIIFADGILESRREAERNFTYLKIYMAAKNLLLFTGGYYVRLQRDIMLQRGPERGGSVFLKLLVSRTLKWE